MNVPCRYFSLLILLLPATAATQDLDLLENPVDPELMKAIADCEACHGKDGISPTPSTPTIASYSAYYMENSLILFQANGRPCPKISYPSGPKSGTQTTMCAAVAELDDYTFSEIAYYFSEKPFKPAIQAFDPNLVKTGKTLHEKHCQECHQDGSTASTDSGILAGQWTPFLNAQLEAFAAGKRPMDAEMKAKIETLGPKDITALLHFYASQQ